MPLRPMQATYTIAWLSHDSWSEAYVGTRRLVYEILPQSIAEQRAEDGALCQLALVGANHLMEVALANLLRPFIGKSEAFTQNKFDDASYRLGLTHWTTVLTGAPLSLDAEPFASTERLRIRRHATVHKSSALATVPMARSALCSAVQGAKALHTHFGVGFPYDAFLSKYPAPEETLFSQAPFPPGA
jgi:hypothetical protein